VPAFSKFSLSRALEKRNSTWSGAQLNEPLFEVQNNRGGRNRIRHRCLFGKNRVFLGFFHMRGAAAQVEQAIRYLLSLLFFTFAYLLSFYLLFL